MKIGQAAVVAIAVVLGGYATASDRRDPYEPFNRGVHRFNDRLDRAVVQPAARAYRAVLPSFVRASVGNVFSNIGDVRNALKNGLQGKLGAAYACTSRLEQMKRFASCTMVRGAGSLRNQRPSAQAWARS